MIAFLNSDSGKTWAGRKVICWMYRKSGAISPLAKTYDSFGRYSELLGWSADNERLYYTETHGTSLRLMAMPIRGPNPSEKGEPVEIGADAGMSLAGMFLNAARTHVGYSWETLNAPPEAHCSPMKAWEPRRVSRVQPQKLPSTSRTEVIRWKSTDGLEIEGLLTYPSGYESGEKYPLLLVIHGGPMGVFTRTFDGTAANYPIAAFADRGYVILRPNFRGSSGYGKEFRYANYNDWGGGDFQDILSGVDHVIQLGLADEDRMGVMGWSYGGYMTSWTITQTQRFKAASVGAGVTNLMSFTGTSDIPGFLPDYFHGEFWDSVDIYHTRSPMHQIRGVRTPTLIQHGERDERVPLSQGQELYNALKRQKCTTQMIVYPRTPHGIEEPRLLLDCMERNLAWFDRWLKAE
jgi:dipeptidyl aminopeptidase/acylaminoacyl peptidase